MSKFNKVGLTVILVIVIFVSITSLYLAIKLQKKSGENQDRISYLESRIFDMEAEISDFESRIENCQSDLVSFKEQYGIDQILHIYNAH